MGVALCHAEIGAIEAAGLYPHQHLRALGRGFCDLGDGGAVGAVDISLHGIISICCEAAYSAACRWAPDIMPSSRLRMMVSASCMMRDTSSAQLGMSWINPCTWPADQMPSSASPVAYTILPRAPATRSRTCSKVAPSFSMATTLVEIAFLATREVLRMVRKISSVSRSSLATIFSLIS